MGQVLSEYMPRRSLPALLAVHALAMLLCGWAGLIGLLVALLVWGVVRHYLQERLGGTTGDTAGALVELVEVGVLLGWALLGGCAARMMPGPGPAFAPRSGLPPSESSAAFCRSVDHGAMACAARPGF